MYRTKNNLVPPTGMRNIYVSEESQSNYLVCTGSNLIELFLFSFSPCFMLRSKKSQHPSPKK